MKFGEEVPLGFSSMDLDGRPPHDSYDYYGAVLEVFRGQFPVDAVGARLAAAQATDSMASSGIEIGAQPAIDPSHAVVLGAMPVGVTINRPQA